MQLFGGPSPIIPRVAEKDVPKVRQGRSLFDAVANRRECPHLGRRVRHRRTSWRPTRPCAAAGPADAAPAAPATPGRGVGRGRVRPVAAVAGIAAVAATTCGAVRRSARCAMASYWCCASSHVADDTGYLRRSQALVQSDFAPSAVARLPPFSVIRFMGTRPSIRQSKRAGALAFPAALASRRIPVVPGATFVIFAPALMDIR
jgi:hypothetical protein